MDVRDIHDRWQQALLAVEHGMRKELVAEMSLFRVIYSVRAETGLRLVFL
jgi:hypothetical protein